MGKQGCGDAGMQGSEAAPSCSLWDSCARAHSWAAHHCQAGSCSFRCALIQRDLGCAIFTCCLFGGKALSKESALLVWRDVGRSQTFVSLGIQYFDGVLCIWFCAFGKLQFHRKWTIHLHCKIKAWSMLQVHRLLPTCRAVSIAGHQRCHVGFWLSKRKKKKQLTTQYCLFYWGTITYLQWWWVWGLKATAFWQCPEKWWAFKCRRSSNCLKVPPQCCEHCWRSSC